MTSGSWDEVHHRIQWWGTSSRLAVMDDQSMPRKNQASPKGAYTHQLKARFVDKYCMYGLKLVINDCFLNGKSHSPFNCCSPFLTRFCQFFRLRRFILKKCFWGFSTKNPSLRRPCKNSKFLYCNVVASMILEKFQGSPILIKIFTHRIQIMKAEDESALKRRYVARILRSSASGGSSHEGSTTGHFLR